MSYTMEECPSSRRSFLKSTAATGALALPACAALEKWLKNATSETVQGLEDLPLREQLVRATVCLVYFDNEPPFRDRRRGAGIFLGKRNGRFYFVGPEHIRTKPDPIPREKLLLEALTANSRFPNLHGFENHAAYADRDFMCLEGGVMEGEEIPEMISLHTERYFLESILPFLRETKEPVHAVALDVVDRHGKWSSHNMRFLSVPIIEPLDSLTSGYRGDETAGEHSYRSLWVARDVMYPGVSGAPIFLMRIKNGKMELLVDGFDKPIMIGLHGKSPKGSGMAESHISITPTFDVTDNLERLGISFFNYSAGSPRWSSA